MGDIVYCCKRIYLAGMMDDVRCSRIMKVERNGKPYCGQHDPEKVAARRAKSDATAQEKRDADTQRRMSAQQLVNKLGVGRPHYDSVVTHGYTGGVVLSAEEARRLIARGERP